MPKIFLARPKHSKHRPIARSRHLAAITAEAKDYRSQYQLFWLGLLLASVVTFLECKLIRTSGQERGLVGLVTAGNVAERKQEVVFSDALSPFRTLFNHVMKRR
jgi:hypothetical protein